VSELHLEELLRDLVDLPVCGLGRQNHLSECVSE
jgi:hypothetical protein